MATSNEPDHTKQPLSAHILELRTRLLISTLCLAVAFGISYYFADSIYRFLIQPLADSYEGQTGKRLIYTGLAEAFFTKVKMSFFVALFISFPIIAHQCYLFLAPGLYKKEKHVLLPFLLAAPILFFLGGALVYYQIFPMAWKFFLSFETDANVSGLPIQLEARISEYLSIVLQLVFAFGIAFQLPIVLMLLARAKIVTAQSLARKRKFAIIGAVTLAAILTPPDIISQIGLAIPLMILYECSIILCKITCKNDAQYSTNT